MSDGEDAKLGKHVAKTYKPTPEEFAAVESLASRRKGRPPAPNLKITRAVKVSVSPWITPTRTPVGSCWSTRWAA